MSPRQRTPAQMRCMVLEVPGTDLVARERAVPQPGPGQVCIRVLACGVCRTDLHLRDGELPDPKMPVIPGHEVVGEVDALGEGVRDLAPGQRVGVAWLGWACGECEHCRAGRENLCQRARFTGYTLDGGYGQYMLADAGYVVPVPERYEAAAAAPLLCAGLIGFRAYRLAGEEARRIGLYGFGAAAHILCQVAVHEQRQVFAFTRPGDERGQRFARELGAHWAGGSDRPPPVPLDAALIFAPVGALVPAALEAVRPGGTVVCAGIHMSAIPSFPYRLLWRERVLRSVANLTRADGRDFMQLAARTPIQTRTHTYRLADANAALEDLRQGRFDGAAVLVP
ncbi:MAG TPA: zinc-dependent alcohol dehydrogenase family protein [Xanthomonadaceae bacterium]|nr:zinc-dependent alcohol dehydrogenase family protein [Xanthomonadaceae bacterium]